MADRKYQICKCCVMDTSDEDIVFDSNGICMRCNGCKERMRNNDCLLCCRTIFRSMDLQYRITHLDYSSICRSAAHTGLLR